MTFIEPCLGSRKTPKQALDDLAKTINAIVAKHKDR